jgi:nicotinate-nucleotide adenylyltransferase
MANGSTTGIFGGTFDPPHLGHLAAAQEACVALGLDRVLFVPAGQNPLKLGEQISAPEHRLAMTELAIEDDPAFAISRADLDRVGPSYTVDLLERLHAELGPDEELAFITGTDVLHELHRWRSPERILQLARLVAINRPGERVIYPNELETRVAGARERVTVIQTPGVAVSSTELRARVARGQPIRYLVPDAVAAYVADHRLYLPTGSAPTAERS